MGANSLILHFWRAKFISYVDYICIINTHIRKDLTKNIKNNRYVGNAHIIPVQTFSPGQVRGRAGQDGGHTTRHSTRHELCSTFNIRIIYL